MKKKFIVPYMLAGAATFVGGLHFTESIASPINSEGQRYTIKSYEKLDNSSDSVLNVEEWAYTEPYAIKTIERKSDVLYIMSTGDTICRTGAHAHGAIIIREIWHTVNLHAPKAQSAKVANSQYFQTTKQVARHWRTCCCPTATRT